MKEELMTDVMQQMLPYLDNAQLKQLKKVMGQVLFRYKGYRRKNRVGRGQ